MVAGQARWVMPLKYCHCTVSDQRCTSSSSLRLEACSRYSSETIRRMDRRGAFGVADACIMQPHGGAEEVRLRPMTRAVAVRHHWRQCGLDVGRRHALRQHRQRLAQIDRGFKTSAEAVVGGPSDGFQSQRNWRQWNASWEFAPPATPRNVSVQCGVAAFCRVDY